MVHAKQLNPNRERRRNGVIQTYCGTCGRWIINSGYAAHIMAHVAERKWNKEKERAAAPATAADGGDSGA